MELTDDVYNDMNKRNKIEKKAIKKISHQFKIKDKQFNDIQKKPLLLISPKDIDKKVVKILVSFE